MVQGVYIYQPAGQGDARERHWEPKDMRNYAFLFTGLLAFTVQAEPQSGGSKPSEPESAVAARWVEHDVDFHFFGMSLEHSVYYDCDALATKVERLLRLAGARRDLNVRASGCYGGADRVSIMIHADLHFHSPTLAPQSGEVAPAEAPPPATAQWKPVKLQLGRTAGFDVGDCMLVEQFKRQILKYFDVRNVTSNLPCDISVGSPRSRASLAFEALTATPAAEEESILAEKQAKKRDDQMKSERKN
jgi:hypothetical protein